MTAQETTKMTFSQAKMYTMPFGKHKGKLIDEIATTDSGLKYIAWLQEQRFSDGKRELLDLAMTIYLADKTIAAELKRIS